MKKKNIAMLVSVVLLLGAAIGGTLAWLTAETSEVKNTFTPSNISITLDETKPTNKEDIKMIPGTVIEKDPKVTVKEGSVPCWLFIKVDAKNTTDYLDYTVDTTKWTLYKTVDTASYYYCKVPTGVTAETAATLIAADTEFPILTGNQVKVSEALDNAKMEVLNDPAKRPTLAFEAAAVQYANIADQDAAWAALPTEFTT